MDGYPLDDPTTYRRLTGRLLYMSDTGPDIAFSVQKLSSWIAHESPI